MPGEKRTVVLHETKTCDHRAVLIRAAFRWLDVAAGGETVKQRSQPTTRCIRLHTYEGKQHGFHNDTTLRYDETAAKLAWAGSLEFFNKYLR